MNLEVQHDNQVLIYGTDTQKDKALPSVDSNNSSVPYQKVKKKSVITTASFGLKEKVKEEDEIVHGLGVEHALGHH